MDLGFVTCTMISLTLTNRQLWIQSTSLEFLLLLMHRICTSQAWFEQQCLVKIHPATFIQDVLDSYRAHLSKHWSQEQIVDVEKEHQHLRLIYDHKPQITKTFNQHDENTFFNNAWNVVKSRFSNLCQFCGGLAMASSNTAAVENNFSMVKWE